MPWSDEAQRSDSGYCLVSIVDPEFPFHAAADGGGLLAGHAAARIPSGAMLLPMLLGALARRRRLADGGAAGWLLAMAYAVLGWTVEMLQF